MTVAVAATGDSLDADVAMHFARCKYFLIAHSDTSRLEWFSNPARWKTNEAGCAAVQALVNRRAELVLAGQFSPKAQLAMEKIGMHHTKASGKVRDALVEHANLQVTPLPNGRTSRRNGT